MDFFEAVKRRRSVRRYTDKKVPPEVMKRAFEAAQIAPNSSNLQTCRFYWVKSPDAKRALAEACLSQGAATTSQELVVVAAERHLWKAHNTALLKHLRAQGTNPPIERYYGKLIPALYGMRWLTPIKFIAFHVIGLFRPFSRRPATGRDLDEVAIKSAALAAENFMLAIAAQDFDTCPMEGFDEHRVKKVIGARCGTRIVMVISVGERSPKGIWGAQFRFPMDEFLKEI